MSRRSSRTRKARGLPLIFWWASRVQVSGYTPIRQGGVSTRPQIRVCKPQPAERLNQKREVTLPIRSCQFVTNWSAAAWRLVGNPTVAGPDQFQVIVSGWRLERVNN